MSKIATISNPFAILFADSMIANGTHPTHITISKGPGKGGSLIINKAEAGTKNAIKISFKKNGTMTLFLNKKTSYILSANRYDLHTTDKGNVVLHETSSEKSDIKIYNKK